MNEPNVRGFLARRRAARQAVERRRRWEHLRDVNAPPDAFGHYGPGHPGYTGTPPVYGPAGQQPVPDHQPGPSSKLQAAASPLIAALGVVLLVTGGTPVVSGRWQPLWLLAGLLAAAAGAWSSLRCFEDGHHRATIGAGAGALLVLLALILGIRAQVVVDGQAKVSTGDAAAATRLAEEAARSLDVLRRNQVLLELAPEQAAALLEDYQAAVDENLEMARRWNPATLGDLPGDGLAAVADVLNKAAVWQADAVAGFALNVSDPAAAIAAEVERLRVEVAALIAAGGPIETLIDDAYRRSTGTSGSLFTRSEPSAVEER